MLVKTLKDLTRIGMGLKRWILFAFLGFLLIILGITEMLDNRFFSRNYILYFSFLILSGLFILYISILEALKNFVKLMRDGMFQVNLDSREINSLFTEKRQQTQGPRIVVIGGGTGLSTMLRGLKFYSSNLTAVVSVGDDGGSSGTLRDEIGMLPPGDIRNCLVALANTGTTMEDLLQYRFQEGSLKNQSFGNLFLAAMNGVSEDFEQAVVKMSEVLAITGKVLPVTLEDLRLSAEMKDGTIIEGESNIGRAVRGDNPITRLRIHPEDAHTPESVKQALSEAQAIVLGPGSLYTSVMPNLLIPDVAKAIRESKAKVFYISNIMTQPGETDGLSVVEHLEKIMEHADIGGIDYVVVNNRPLSDQLAIKNYIASGAEEVAFDRQAVEKLGVKVIEADLLKTTGIQIRHDSKKLSKVLFEAIMKERELKYSLSALGYLMNRERKIMEEEMIRAEARKMIRASEEKREKLNL